MKSWICDSCKQEIKSSKDGWVEWINTSAESPGGRGLRLVHKFGAGPSKKDGCMYDEDKEFSKDNGTVADLPLAEFLGSDGLMRLLAFMSEEELPKDEVLELIKRLHIPGYEHARQHFRYAINGGAFSPNMPPNYYFQEDIEATLKYVKKHERA